MSIIAKLSMRVIKRNVVCNTVALFLFGTQKCYIKSKQRLFLVKVDMMSTNRSPEGYFPDKCLLRGNTWHNYANIRFRKFISVNDTLIWAIKKTVFFNIEVREYLPFSIKNDSSNGKRTVTKIVHEGRSAHCRSGKSEPLFYRFSFVKTSSISLINKDL